MPSNDIPDPHRDVAANYALHARPPTASTPLWAHILQPKSRAPTTLADIPAAVPLSAPLDKNATSMRILLHDTQANLEKFGTHIQSLMDGVKEAKKEIKTANSLFERDRECFMGDITDLINRSQKEIQKAVGIPAQSERIQSFFQDFTGQLSRLDQRLDALQTFNQTHSQALQTQMQAVQILLDKQGSIITAVLPLLPLMQALPLYIDAAKNSICENITKALSAHVSVMSKSYTGLACTPHDPVSDGTTKRKRTDDYSPAGISSGRVLSRKRRRSGVSVTSPPTSSQRRSPPENIAPTRSLSKLPDPPAPHARTAASISGLSPIDHTLTMSVRTTRRDSDASAARKLATPRRPLSELLPSLLPPNSFATPRPQTLSGSGRVGATTNRPSTRTALSVSAQLKSGFYDNPASPTVAQLPNLVSSVDTSKSGNLGPHFRRNSVTNRPTHPAGQKALKRPTLVAQKEFLLVPTRAVPTTPALHGTGQPGATNGGTLPGTPEILPRTDHVRTGGQPNSVNPTVAASATALSSVTGIQNGEINLPTYSAIIGKERRSPPRERRRFIPLVDSEDEEEE